MQDRLLVGIDVGCRQHRVAIARSTGEIVKEFSVPHTASGFGTLFAELEHCESTFQLPIVIGMEGFNGYAWPLDQWIGQKGYPLLNINNLEQKRGQATFSAATRAILPALLLIEGGLWSENVPHGWGGHWKSWESAEERCDHNRKRVAKMGQLRVERNGGKPCVCLPMQTTALSLPFLGKTHSTIQAAGRRQRAGRSSGPFGESAS
jgi:hypothetical protein